MNNEKPKNPHLKIEHIKDKFITDNSADLPKPEEITPDFLKEIESVEEVDSDQIEYEGMDLEKLKQIYEKYKSENGILKNKEVRIKFVKNLIKLLGKIYKLETDEDKKAKFAHELSFLIRDMEGIQSS